MIRLAAAALAAVVQAGAADPPGPPPPGSPADRLSHAFAGDVWVNAATRIYYCPTDHLYGMTEYGSFMKEAEAAAAGARPRDGSACNRK